MGEVSIKQVNYELTHEGYTEELVKRLPGHNDLRQVLEVLLDAYI